VSSSPTSGCYRDRNLGVKRRIETAYRVHHWNRTSAIDGAVGRRLYSSRVVVVSIQTSSGTSQKGLLISWRKCEGRKPPDGASTGTITDLTPLALPIDILRVPPVGAQCWHLYWHLMKVRYSYYTVTRKL
jgi:hypothetical protein